MRGPRRWQTTGTERAGGYRLVVVAAMLIGWSVGFHVHGLAFGAPMFSPSTRVVLFTAASSDPLVARLEGELAAVGIAVRRVPLPPDSRLDDVVTREIAAGASAVIRIIAHSRGTEVWTADTTARVASRRSIKADTSDAALSVIALRTVEFLRASLLEVRRREATTGIAARSPSDEPAPGAPFSQSPAPGPRREVAPPDRNPSEERPPGPRSTPAQAMATAQASATRSAEPATVRSGEGLGARLADGTQIRASEPSSVPPAATRVKEAVPSTNSTEPGVTWAKRSGPAAKPQGRRAEQFEIAVGPGVLASPGGIGSIGAIAAIGRGQILGPLGVELMAVFPVIPARFSDVYGTEEVSAALFGGGATMRLTPAPDAWLVDLAFGISATMLKAVGTMVGPESVAGTTKSTMKITGNARLGAGVLLNRWLVLRLDGIAGVVASRTLFGDGSDHSWGPLFAGGVLALQANW